MDIVYCACVAFVAASLLHAVVRALFRTRPVGVKRLSADARVPAKATRGSAGFDLYAPRAVCVPRREPTVVPLDIAIECPPRCYARIAPRSGLAARFGLRVLGGVVDGDYRGNVAVLLWHDRSAPLRFERGDAIAQLIFERCDARVELVETDRLSATRRGAGGFGSTTPAFDGASASADGAGQ